MKDQIEILKRGLAKSERERPAMAGALNIVHDESEKLLEADCDPQRVAEKLKLFSSLGRYKFTCAPGRESSYERPRKL